MDAFNNIYLSETIIVMLFLFVFFVCLAATFIYRKIALRIGILANPNLRTLHKNSIPNGGGIVFSLVFIICIFILFLLGQLSENIFKIFFYGAFVATLFGFLDDLKDISASKKMLVQILLSGWTLFCLDGGVLFGFEKIPSIISLALSMFFLVWMINAYNFMDGIDGMAISGATFVSGLMALSLQLTNGSPELILILLILMSCTSALMVFNWPPATIFMGDAGSIFLGYIFGAIILISIINDDVSIWTWLVIFGYFFADTSMTQILRLILVKKWYKAHRSHAYQNLARITDSHFKVTMSVTTYHLVWISPLTFWSVLQPEMAIIPAILAVTPGLFFTYKYGPTLSSS